MAAGQSLATLLFEVSTLDPTPYVGVLILLVVAAGLACSAPALRAPRVDPVRTLRTE